MQIIFVHFAIFQTVYFRTADKTVFFWQNSGKKEMENPLMNQNSFPPQQQPPPGREFQMQPKPLYDDPAYKPGGKLTGKTAIITGGDSGIGRAVAVAFAKEGADVLIAYLKADADTAETKGAVEGYGRRCEPVRADLRQEPEAFRVVGEAIRALGHIDVLVNNIAVQYPQNSLSDIPDGQLDDTFRTNVFSYFFMAKAALPHLKAGAAIINTASVTAYKGSEDLLDYSSAKGAIVSLTRSLSMSLVKNGIRVNAVAPGPVWTPLIVSSFSPQKVAEFGKNVPMQRAAQPAELAPAYVYLACADSSYMSGQVLHINGGVIVDS
jgi:NAD(P)-dependent dehydrogenase (short-subunit alcohol dehydrogenase family)